MHSCKCRVYAANTLGCQSDVSFVVIAPLYIHIESRTELLFPESGINSFSWPSKRRSAKENRQKNVSLETNHSFRLQCSSKCKAINFQSQIKMAIDELAFDKKIISHRYTHGADLGTTTKQDSIVTNEQIKHIDASHTHTLRRSHYTQSITSPLNYAAPHARIYCVEIS